MSLYLASNALTSMSDLFVDLILLASCAVFLQTRQVLSGADFCYNGALYISITLEKAVKFSFSK